MRRAKGMKTFDFIQMTISHNLKDPHPKALEPDCLSPFLAIAAQSLRAGLRALAGHTPRGCRPKKKEEENERFGHSRKSTVGGNSDILLDQP